MTPCPPKPKHPLLYPTDMKPLEAYFFTTDDDYSCNHAEWVIANHLKIPFISIECILVHSLHMRTYYFPQSLVMWNSKTVGKNNNTLLNWITTIHSQANEMQIT